jgi:D-alanine-D-alanine ligase
MASRKRALLLVHPYFRPDRKKARSQTEKDVWLGLKRLGFHCEVSVAQSDLRDLDRDLAQHKPHFVFNLLEEFRDEGVFDFHAVTFLEARGVTYTGCNPRGLIVSRNKTWTAQIARSMAVRSPGTWSAREALRISEESFPLILKFNNEHASLGMTKKSVVRNRADLRPRLRELSRYTAEVVAQEFISGREVSVAVTGNRKLRAFHPRELRLRSDASFVTEKVKFNAKYRNRLGIRALQFAGDPQIIRSLQNSSCRMFEAMKLSGYARFDYRLDRAGNSHLIDVNANPNLARDEDFALSAKRGGLAYEDLLTKIIRLAQDYRPQG